MQESKPQSDIHNVFNDTHMKRLVDTETWTFLKNDKPFTFLNLFKARHQQIHSFDSNNNVIENETYTNEKIISFVQQLEKSLNYKQPQKSNDPNAKQRRGSVYLNYEQFQVSDHHSYSPSKQQLVKLNFQPAQVKSMLNKSASSQKIQLQPANQKYVNFSPLKNVINSQNKSNNYQKNQPQVIKSHSNCKILLKQIENNIDKQYQQQQSQTGGKSNKNQENNSNKNTYTKQNLLNQFKQKLQEKNIQIAIPVKEEDKTPQQPLSTNRSLNNTKKVKNFIIRSSNNISPVKSNYLKHSITQSNVQNLHKKNTTSQPMLRLQTLQQQQQQYVTSRDKNDDSLENFLAENAGEKRDSKIFKENTFEKLVQNQKQQQYYNSLFNIQNQSPLKSRVQQQQQTKRGSGQGLIQKHFLPQKYTQRTTSRGNNTNKILSKTDQKIINSSSNLNYINNSNKNNNKTQILGQNQQYNQLLLKQQQQIFSDNQNNNNQQQQFQNHRKIKFSDFQDALKEISSYNKQKNL